MRADNIEDYGERLSSIERENKGIEKLSGIIEPSTQEDAAEEDGMSMQQVAKLQEKETSSKQVLSKEENNDSQKDKIKDQNIVSPEVNSRAQDLETKQLKPEKNDVSQSEMEPEISKSDLTEEHESSKPSVDKVDVDVESSTKCTTDREVTIGDYKPPQDSHSNEIDESHDEDEGEGDGDGDGDGEGDGDGDGESDGDGEGEDEQTNDISDEPEKKVSKIYKGPKPAKAPDHYIDDI